MPCKTCKTKPVIRLTNTSVQLCKSCFIKYFEKKTLKTIRQYNLIQKNDSLGIACSGGKDSTSLLYIIHRHFSKRPDIKITAIAIDEGIKGYRDSSLQDLKKFCKTNKINLKIFSFKKEFHKTLDQLIKICNKPCSVCGVLRRYMLNKYARKLKITKLITGHNLDDEAQSIIMNQFRNNMALSARLGPLTGIVIDKRFIKRAKPFYFLTEKEVKTYSFLKGIVDNFNECPYSLDSYRGEVRDLLNDFEANHEGTKHSIINSFIEILPLLKKHYSTANLKEIKNCNICGEPCSQDTCQACLFAKEIVEQNLKA